MTNKQHQRSEAAKKLESLGWALIRYARRIQRCVEVPEEPKYERSAEQWIDEGRQWLREFAVARREYLA